MAVNDNADFSHALVIETDSYAGSFEREMCAYATGSVGDCGVGNQWVLNWLSAAIARFPNMHPEDIECLTDWTRNISDDNGYYRPASIWNLPDSHGYKAVAIFFESWPTDKGYLDFVIERARDFAKLKGIKVTRIVKLDREVVVNDSLTEIV